MNVIFYGLFIKGKGRRIKAVVPIEVITQKMGKNEVVKQPATVDHFKKC